MMLTGNQIAEDVKSGKIVISPFDESLINPNSYNFRIGNTLKVYDEEVIDIRHKPKTREIEIPEDGIIIEPNKLYLGHTIERMGSDSYIPMIGGRSSTGRLGLFVIITAPLGDIGYAGQWTLQLYSATRIKLYPGQQIGQILFISPKGDIDLYRGKYQSGVGPQPYTGKGLLYEGDTDPYSPMIEEYNKLSKQKKALLESEIDLSLSRLLQHIDTKEKLLALDIGCGLGLMLKSFEKKIDGTIIGMDTSAKLIDYCIDTTTKSHLMLHDFHMLGNG